MRYTYGTSEGAARRLESIAKFFNPLALGLIRQHLELPVSVALDLGCAAGFSTEMLSHAARGATVYGMDKSSDFLTMARRRCPDIRFLEHDVTVMPFPVEGELMYARFLLSLLKDVVDLVNRWTNELTPGDSFSWRSSKRSTRNSRFFGGISILTPR